MLCCRSMLCCCAIAPTASALCTVRRGPVTVDVWLKEWSSLVTKGTISGQAVHPVTGDQVRYGLRLDGQGNPQEFCEAISQDAGSKSLLLPSRSTVAENGFNVILRANRALRPPAALQLSELPPHEEEACSLCTGPLRLAARPMVAQAVLESSRCWDVHYNISPQEPGGHFLLVPEIAKPENRRAQRLVAADCEDLVALGRAAAGRLCVSYNSPNAGGSQNHLHVHAWVIGERPYAITKATPAEGTQVMLFGGKVTACVLNWPALVIRMHGGTSGQVGALLDVLCTMEPCHNVVVIGEETFLFLRRADGQVSPHMPGLKIGSTQLLGHYVVDTAEQYDTAVSGGAPALEASLRATRGSGDLDADALLARAVELLSDHAA
jgi:hypothetical protein